MKNGNFQKYFISLKLGEGTIHDDEPIMFGLPIQDIKLIREVNTDEIAKSHIEMNDGTIYWSSDTVEFLVEIIMR